MFIDCLARSRLITPKQMNEVLTFLHSSLTENKVIISKEKMRDTYPLGHDKIPCKFYDPFAFLSKVERPSTQSMKKYGDNGSPCFIPHDGLINPLGSQLISTSHTVVALLYTYKIEIL